MEEKWIDIKGYDGKYRVSDIGRVYSVKRDLIFSLSVTSNGYIQVSLCKNGTHKWHRIHRLVALMFLPEYSEEMQVDHVDGDINNNKVSNLRMATGRENCGNQKKRKGSASKFKGVHWHKRSQKWEVKMIINKKHTYLGSFQSEEEAARIYDKYALKVYGKFAKTNKDLGLYKDEESK